MGPFAHTTAGPETAWEPLDHHLEAVALAAERFASKFDAGTLGRAAGILHSGVRIERSDSGNWHLGVVCRLFRTGP